MRYIAIVGRPNVGKSTLFNKIVGGRPAIVDDTPGVTRDRNVAAASWFGRKFYVIDSGGFEPDATDIILSQMREQTLMAVEEADVIYFMVDGRAGVTPTDVEIARVLRRTDKPVKLIVNKIDDPKLANATADFASLGFDDIRAISAEHSKGIDDLLEEELSPFPPDPEDEGPEENEPIRVAVIGKPNVGKSSLVNRVLGARRMMVSDIAGTTRDSIDTTFERDGRRYTLIDTAGIRRKAKVSAKLEKFSVIMAVKAIERADVALLMVDAVDGISNQEAKIAGLVEEAGKACVIVVNKWDAVEDKETNTVNLYEEAIRQQLKFIAWAPIVFVSALTGQRIDKIFATVDRVYEQYTQRLGTAEVNRLVDELTGGKEPPMYRGQRVKFYYVTQARTAPPGFVFMTNHPEGIHFSYRRHIANRLRELTGFAETPIRLTFRKPSGRRTTPPDNRPRPDAGKGKRRRP
jgi:GTP-binding protein